MRDIDPVLISREVLDDGHEIVELRIGEIAPGQTRSAQLTLEQARTVARALVAAIKADGL